MKSVSALCFPKSKSYFSFNGNSASLPLKEKYKMDLGKRGPRQPKHFKIQSNTFIHTMLCCQIPINSNMTGNTTKRQSKLLCLVLKDALCQHIYGGLNFNVRIRRNRNVFLARTLFSVKKNFGRQKFREVEILLKKL